MNAGMGALMWMPVRPPRLDTLLAWHTQPIPVLPVLCLVLWLTYIAGVVRLRSRGHRWPVGRLVGWTLGLLTVVAVTGTAVNGYGMRMFSVHMVQHMVLSMLSPLLLLMGAPVTLSLRALPARGAGGRVRRRLVQVLHSRALRVLTAPALTLPVFIASLYGLYFTPLFDAAMRTWWGHDWMLLHFVAVGLLLFWPIMAIDPSPRTTTPVLRMLELFMAMPFHAFFGVVVMTSSTLLVRSFAQSPSGWSTSPVVDQRLGGGIAWAFSEIPTLLVVAAVFAQWARSSDREARRGDRAAARDGDQVLGQYNAWLAQLSRMDANRPAKPGSAG